MSPDEADHFFASVLEELEEHDAVVEAEDLDAFDPLLLLSRHRSLRPVQNEQETKIDN